jgi:hypothetical protein
VADPIDLSMVVSSALPSTFAFLYQRLDALLSRHRADPGTAQPEAAPDIPAVVVGELELPLRADEDRVQTRLAELRAYALGLAHYRANPAGISPEDSLLLQTLSDLRGALEDIYGQRFTFAGERRERSGPYSDQRYGQIAGEVIGMEATDIIRGKTTSKITADSVERGGRVVGMRAPEIGGGP